MDFRKIELHIDSVAVVHVISARNTNNKLAWSMQLNIRKLLDWEVQIEHAYHEANKCDDVLANEGCNWVEK
jgi:hypothetical protein